MSRSFYVGLSLTAGLLFVNPGIARAAEGDDLVLDLGDVNLELKRVPHGGFTMGSPASEVGHEKDEEPSRPVTITRDYWIAKTPVTRGQFAHFVTDTKYVTEAEKGQVGGSGWDGKALVQKKDFSWRNPGFTQTDDHPVVMVTFADASAFAAWASRKTAKRVRLPSEAEFEFAARAGTTSPWYGAKTEEDVLNLGWFKTNGGNGTHSVGQKKPNALGLYDMAGDVFEWCRDIYGPYSKEPGIDPEITQHAGTDPERRVLRGGSWLRDPKRGRSAARYRNAPGARNADNGFRVVVTADDMLGPGFVSPTLDPVQSAPTPVSTLDAGVGPTGPAVESSQDAFGLLMMFAAPSTAALMVLGWIFGRRRTTAAAGSTGSMTRAVEDGFFVRVGAARVGSRVRYTCNAGDEELSDDAPFDGAEETFVYTGARPSAIRILEILPPVIAAARVVVPPTERTAPPAGERFSRPLSKPPPSRIEEKVPSIIIEAGVEVEKPDDSSPELEPSGTAVEQVTEPLVMPGPPPSPRALTMKPPSPARASTSIGTESAPEIEPEEEESAPAIEPEALEDNAPVSAVIVPSPVISVRDLPVAEPVVLPVEAAEAAEAAEAVEAADEAPAASKPIEPTPVVSMRDIPLPFAPESQGDETPESEAEPMMLQPKIAKVSMPAPPTSEERVGPPSLPPPSIPLDEKSTTPDMRALAPAIDAAVPPPASGAEKMSAKARKRARAAARKAARANKRQSQPELGGGDPTGRQPSETDEDDNDETAPAPPVAPNDDEKKD